MDKQSNDSDDLTLSSKEDLLQTLLRDNCAAWGDRDLYEGQIQKLKEGMGANQSKNWSGQELEDLIKDVVECTLDLMEMAEIESEEE